MTRPTLFKKGPMNVAERVRRHRKKLARAKAAENPKAEKRADRERELNSIGYEVDIYSADEGGNVRLKNSTTDGWTGDECRHDYCIRLLATQARQASLTGAGQHSQTGYQGRTTNPAG